MRIKLFYTAILMVAIGSTAWAQSSTESYSLEIPKDNMIEFNGGYAHNFVFRFRTKPNRPTATAGGGLTFGVAYNRKVTDALWIGGGVNFMGLKNTYQSSTEPVIKKECLSNIWSIPFYVRYDIMKWLYIKGGLAFDIQTNSTEGRYINNQSGMSPIAAVGFDFALSPTWHIGLEAHGGLTSLVAFRINEKEKYSTHQRFLYFAETLNIFYRF